MNGCGWIVLLGTRGFANFYFYGLSFAFASAIQPFGQGDGEAGGLDTQARFEQAVGQR